MTRAALRQSIKDWILVTGGAIVVAGIVVASFSVVARAYGINRLEARQDSLVMVIHALEASRDSLSKRYCRIVVAMGMEWMEWTECE